MITFLAIVLAGISLSWIVMYFRKESSSQQKNNVDEDAEIFIGYDFSFYDELLSDAADIDVEFTHHTDIPCKICENSPKYSGSHLLVWNYDENHPEVLAFKQRVKDQCSELTFKLLNESQFARAQAANTDQQITHTFKSKSKIENEKQIELENKQRKLIELMNESKVRFE